MYNIIVGNYWEYIYCNIPTEIYAIIYVETNYYEEIYTCVVSFYGDKKAGRNESIRYTFLLFHPRKVRSYKCHEDKLAIYKSKGRSIKGWQKLLLILRLEKD